MARNALGRAWRLLADDDWKASAAAWEELDRLTDEVGEVNQRATDPNYSPAQAAIDALREAAGE